jgi:hypothetical protein
MLGLEDAKFIVTFNQLLRNYGNQRNVGYPENRLGFHFC